MSYIQAKNGRDGNERYIFHFLLFLTDKEQEEEPQSIHKTNDLFNLALRKAKKRFTARSYNGSNFGGGIVISTNNPDTVINKIKNS